MNVLFDISAVSGGSGIGRVVSEIAHGLAATRECDTTFCAAGSLTGVLEADQFLKRHPQYVSGLSHVGLAKALASPTGRLRSLTGRRAADLVARAAGIMRRRVRASLLIKANVFHTPYGRFPAQIKRARLKRFMTMHDALPLLRPELFTAGQLAVYRRMVGSIGPEDHLICVSQSTQNDLCRLGVAREDQCTVIPLAANPRLFYRCQNEQQLSRVRAKHKLPTTRFILSLATLEPRKNLAHLVRCFAQVAKEPRMAGVKLVLAGGSGWKFDELFAAIAEVGEVRDRIVLPGYIAEEDLAAVYSLASLFVYPSLYEGFGLPPLEAMQCGLPVISSNTSSLPEVVGNAGVLINPNDADQLCEAMLDVLGSGERQAALTARSLERATVFSWDRTIDMHLAAYRRAIG